MPATTLDSLIFRDIFTTEAMRRVFSDEQRTAFYLEIEAALARVQGRLGIIPSHGGITRLVKLIGLARARDVILGGEELAAEAAYRIGLVSDVIEGDIVAAGRDRLALMLQRSPQAYAAAKRLLWLAANADLESGIVAEGLAQSLLIGTEEHREARWRR